MIHALNRLFPILATAALFSLAGCASTSQHTMITPEDDQAATVLSSLQRESTFVWVRIIPLTVDQKYVEVSAWSGLPSDALKTPSGKRSIVAELTFNRGFGIPQLISQISLDATLVAGKTYKFVGLVQGTQAQAWLEEDSGGKASTVGTATLGTSTAVQAPLFIPIPSR